MHLLITRPRKEAEALGAELSLRGVASTVSPLLEIELLPPEPGAFEGVQGLVATSRNGLRALAQSPALAQAMTLPLYAVGPGTAELARSLGFTTIITGPGTARELAPVIVEHVRPEAGRLVQLGGDKLAFDLGGALAASGVLIDVLTVYRSRPAGGLSLDAIERLKSGAIETVLLTSPLAARTFVKLAIEAGIGQSCQRLVYVCLSKQIAAEIAPLQASAVHVASAPNTDACLDLIDTLIRRPAGASG